MERGKEKEKQWDATIEDGPLMYMFMQYFGIDFMREHEIKEVEIDPDSQELSVNFQPRKARNPMTVIREKQGGEKHG